MIAVIGPKDLVAAGNLEPQWQMEIPIGGSRSRATTNLPSIPILGIATGGTGQSPGGEESCLSIHPRLNRGTTMTVRTSHIHEREKIRAEQSLIAVSLCYHDTSLRNGI